MSSGLGANRIFILDALDHGLALQALASGFSLDAVSNSLNISKPELMNKLTPQAPLSNILLIPSLKLEPLSNSTHTPAHSPNQIRKVPLPGATSPPTSFNEPEHTMDLAFIIAFWSSLTIVFSIALLALCTKFKKKVDSNWERVEPLETEEPKDDLARWCLRRRMGRRFEAKKEELEKMKLELEELERFLTGQAKK